jgi:hypothetical protein
MKASDDTCFLWADNITDNSINIYGRLIQLIFGAKAQSICCPT